MPDELNPSPEVEAILREAGWLQDREVETSEWVHKLRNDGTEVFPAAEAILRRFGGLRFVGNRPPRPTRHDFQIEPLLWLGERDRIVDIEAVSGSRACPLGETSGTAMLAVLEDGRVIADLDGCIVQIAETWSRALDSLVLGQGEDLLLAEDTTNRLTRHGPGVLKAVDMGTPARLKVIRGIGRALPSSRIIEVCEFDEERC